MSIPQHPFNPDQPLAIQGAAIDTSDDQSLRSAVERAFDYRGDVTLQLRDGTSVMGYVFDRLIDEKAPDKSVVRLLPTDGRPRTTVHLHQITRIEFAGRDTAAGKSFETWMKNYRARKLAGEKNIHLEPEAID
jgi:hypothetical protein